jgi:hypothetical protein
MTAPTDEQLIEWARPLDQVTLERIGEIPATVKSRLDALTEEHPDITDPVVLEQLASAVVLHKGSTVHGTAQPGKFDVDVAVVVDEPLLDGDLPRTPDALLENIFRELTDTVEFAVDGASGGFFATTTVIDEFAVDVIPSLSHSSGALVVLGGNGYGRLVANWPNQARANILDRDAACGGRLSETIRVAKAMRDLEKQRSRLKGIRSYLLEAVLFAAPIELYRDHAELRPRLEEVLRWSVARLGAATCDLTDVAGHQPLFEAAYEFDRKEAKGGMVSIVDCLEGSTPWA